MFQTNSSYTRWRTLALQSFFFLNFWDKSLVTLCLVGKRLFSLTILLEDVSPQHRAPPVCLLQGWLWCNLKVLFTLLWKSDQIVQCLFHQKLQREPKCLHPFPRGSLLVHCVFWGSNGLGLTMQRWDCGERGCLFNSRKELRTTSQRGFGWSLWVAPNIFLILEKKKKKPKSRAWGVSYPIFGTKWGDSWVLKLVRLFLF